MTLIIVEDNKIGGFTSFYKERPNIIAEGNTKEEAEQNLIELVNSVILYENK